MQLGVTFICCCLLFTQVLSLPEVSEMQEELLLPLNGQEHKMNKRDVAISCLHTTVVDYYVPHPQECRLFYMCSNGSPILMECPGNLVFDPRLNVCNYANGNCFDGSGNGP